jgi:hypothetical protein
MAKEISRKIMEKYSPVLQRKKLARAIFKSVQNKEFIAIQNDKKKRKSSKFSKRSSQNNSKLSEDKYQKLAYHQSRNSRNLSIHSSGGLPRLDDHVNFDSS